MKNLLTLNYWFTTRPESLIVSAQNFFNAYVAFLLLAAIAIFIFKRRPGIYKGIWQRLYLFSVTNAIIGFILLFLNYEAVPFFSARFWLLLWGLSSLVWLLFVIKQLRKIPGLKKKIDAEQEFKKYLP